MLVVGLAMLSGAGLMWLDRQTTTPVGLRLDDTQVGATTAPVTAVANRAPVVDPPAPVQVADPVRILIPRLGVDARSEPLAVTDDVLDGPQELADAGCWADGPEPGEAGAAVIAGHVDSYRRPAVFLSLHELVPGDMATVERADGSREDFSVTGAERFPKTGIPVPRVFDATPGPTLRVITCGGDFDRSAKSHVDNLAVYAVPG